MQLGACAYVPLQAERRQPPHAESPPAVSSSVTVWRLSELATGDHERIALHDAKGTHGMVSGSQIRLIANVAARVFSASPGSATPEVLLAGFSSINAFAFVEDRRPTIAITLGMLSLLGEDANAWAALLGHEFAHLRLNHLQTLGDREKSAEAASTLAGAVLSAIGLPFGSVIADATSTLAKRAYSRDDERDADRAGLEYLIAAGFAPEGALRLQERLLHAGSSQGLSFLSTHPGGDERIAALRELIRAREAAR